MWLAEYVVYIGKNSKISGCNQIVSDSDSGSVTAQERKRWLRRKTTTAAHQQASELGAFHEEPRHKSDVVRL
jgi:hypothetical protein